jgi:predicted nucleic acid-binding protein
MKSLFGDSFYFFALLSPRDQAHDRAVAYTREFDGRLVTTAWVLTELADGCATPPGREAFLHFLDQLRIKPNVLIVPPDAGVFESGLSLYRSRRDKEWSLTDCISFVVMEREGLTEALTGDHHFEQAGYAALLK